MIAELVAGMFGLAAGAGASLGWAHARRKASEHEMHRVSKAIADYFRESGIVAIAYCERLPDRRIVALIEVEPNKRFRSSFVIENTLKQQVQARSGVCPDLVFWRFPLSQKAVDDAGATADHAAPAAAPESRPGEAAVSVASVPGGQPSGVDPASATDRGRATNPAAPADGAVRQLVRELPIVQARPRHAQPRLASPVVSQMDFVQARGRAGQAEYDIDEVPWEHFEQASKPESEKGLATGP